MPREDFSKNRTEGTFPDYRVVIKKFLPVRAKYTGGAKLKNNYWLLPAILLLSAVFSCLPGAPATLSAAAIGPGSIHLDWQAGIGVEDGFIIERSADLIRWREVGRVSSLTSVFDDVGLACGTSYYYRVKAFNGQGNSSYSKTAEAVTFFCEEPMNR